MLRIADREFSSRLLLGTGGFTRMETLAGAIEASGTELVTVAMRRVDAEASGSLVDVIDRAGVLCREFVQTSTGLHTERRPHHSILSVCVRLHRMEYSVLAHDRVLFLSAAELPWPDELRRHWV